MKKLIQKTLNFFGYEIKKNTPVIPPEFNKRDIEIFEYVYNKNLTMIGVERMFSNMFLVKNIINNEIEGDFVECGVWKGGSTLLVKLLFDEYNINKKVWLFDTFEGMTKPNEFDFHIKNSSQAIGKYLKKKNNGYVDWCYSSLDEVKNNFKVAGVNLDNCMFIKGDVIETIPMEENNIKNISFLRLDTDWYDSTKCELDYLYPKITEKGFLAVDDYGHWNGSRKAVDEYYKQNQVKPFVHPIDYSGRIFIKDF